MKTPDTMPDTLSSATGRPLAAAGRSHFHESARAQVAGAVNYIDDIPEVKGTLFAAPILSTVAHGRLRGVDPTAALAMPGVRGVVLAADVPGDPLLATFVHDEPIFAVDTVQHIGQVIGLVVADSVMQARHAARKVQLHIDALADIAASKAWPLELNRHPGYDHSYYFVASFIEAHLRFHARHL